MVLLDSIIWVSVKDSPVVYSKGKVYCCRIVIVIQTFKQQVAHNQRLFTSKTEAQVIYSSLSLKASLTGRLKESKLSYSFHTYGLFLFLSGPSGCDWVYSLQFTGMYWSFIVTGMYFIPSILAVPMVKSCFQFILKARCTYIHVGYLFLSLSYSQDL